MDEKLALELFPHQHEAIEWIRNRKVALLALDMGLGKTAVVIEAAKKINAASVLVICPAIATGNWENEFQKWNATHIKRKIVSYNLASKLGTDEYDLLIVDEAHYLKNFEAQRTKTVFGRNGLVRRAHRTWALSGTPAPNHPGELWPILFTFGATKYNFTKFVQRYCEVRTVRFGGRSAEQISGTKKENISELKEMLSQVMHRKTQGEVLHQLPSINYETIIVPQGAVDWEADPLWSRFAVPSDRSKELFAMLEKERDILQHVLKNTAGIDDKSKAITTLEQGLANLRKYIGLQKVDAVAELVDDELTNNLYPKIVIFAHHQAVIEKLGQKLKHHNVSYLYGKTPKDRRESNIEKFQRFSSYRVMICNIQTAATAINLTASNQVLFVEQDWVPANNAQAAKRCHRIGQTKPVFVRFVALENSIDQQVTETLKRKARDLSLFMKSDAPPPPKIHALDRMIERPEKVESEGPGIDDNLATSPVDFDALCQ